MAKISLANKLHTLKLFLALVLLFTAVGRPPAVLAASTASSPTPIVNIPNLTGVPFTPAVFWMGKVDNFNNYADVRVWYYDDYLKVYVNIMDRQLWTDNTKSANALPNYDSVSLYVNVNGNSGSTLTSKSFRFDRELNTAHYEYVGNGSSWKLASVPIENTDGSDDTGAQGYLNTGGDAKGYHVTFYVPFSSFGVTGTPAAGTIWGLGVVMHDRDDASGSTILNTSWPEQMNPNAPSTWGQMRFGYPSYSPSTALSTSQYTIRQGLNGAIVKDGEVGGHTICGGDPEQSGNFFGGWGSFNYKGYTQINIQNQYDISDWPCFSKYYITFPLDTIPDGKNVISASLTMYLFGNAGGGVWGDPPDSYIQAFTVGQDWDPATLTWNNAPPALENISGTWVHPYPDPSNITWPGVPYTWDVSRAVAAAYATKQPLRLALYSADGERHTGKYFSSSSADDGLATARPALLVVTGTGTGGTTCSFPGITCKYTYLPFIKQ